MRNLCCGVVREEPAGWLVVRDAAARLQREPCMPVHTVGPIQHEVRLSERTLDIAIPLLDVEEIHVGGDARAFDLRRSREQARLKVAAMSRRNGTFRAVPRFAFPVGASMLAMLRNYVRDETGATAIEYGLIAALVSVAAVAALTLLGTSLSSMFGFVASTLDSATTTTP